MTGSPASRPPGLRWLPATSRLRTAPPWAAEVGTVLIVQAAVTIPFVVPRDPGLPAATPVAYAVTTLAVVPLLWRRRAPVTTLLAVFAAQLLYKLALDGPGQSLPYAALVALYTVAALSSPRRRVCVAALTLAVVFPSVAWNSGQARELLFSLFVFAAAYVFGRLTATRQAYTVAVEDRAAQLERANRIEAEQATARERSRIAREMHDILSHAVSIMIVQAEAGPVAVRCDPERAEAAFDAISETGRDAMVQLRRMLGILRENGGETERAPRAPQPSLAELPGLLERVAAGGLLVGYETRGRVLPLSGDTEATVHRVVQEALTNVVRHAGARSVQVCMEYSADLLELMITDDGRGPAVPGSAPAGHGLIGIRERAAAHGGTAVSGPGPGDRGFRVTVRLPVRSALSFAEVGK